MHRTPWSKGGSSVPSDRIKTVVKASTNKSKGKAKEPFVEPSKSKDVRRLEMILQGVRTTTNHETDPKGGCYCLGKGYQKELQDGLNEQFSSITQQEYTNFLLTRPSVVRAA